MSRRASRLLLLIAPLALVACGKKDASETNLDSLDSELVDTNGSAPAHDPALMSALQSQIMVDPALTQSSNGDAVRPPQQPYAQAVPADTIGAAAAAQRAAQANSGPLMHAPNAGGSCPQCQVARNSMTLGALAAQQSTPRTAGCTADLNYSAGWANRLPGDLPLYPDARVTEAAGSDSGQCGLRAVSFSTSASFQRVLDFYYTRATGGGYSAEHQADGAQHVLGGTRARDGGAFVVYVQPRSDGGADVDLIANNGS